MYDKVDRVLGTRDIVTMKHVVEAGTSTASPSSLSANPPSDHDGSQPSTSGTPSPPQKVALLLVAPVGPAKKGSAQRRGKCRPKTLERKVFHQEKPRVNRKVRRKAHFVYGGYAAEPRQTIRNDGIFHGLSSGSHKG